MSHSETLVQSDPNGHAAHINGIENVWSEAKRHRRECNEVPLARFELLLKECERRFRCVSPRDLLRTIRRWTLSWPSPFRTMGSCCNSFSALRGSKQKRASTIENSFMEDCENGEPVIYQCNGANCRKKKGKRLDYYMKKYDLKDKIEVEIIGCNNKCEQAPVFHLDPDDIWFSEKDLGMVLKKHILNRYA